MAKNSIGYCVSDGLHLELFLEAMLHSKFWLLVFIVAFAYRCFTVDGWDYTFGRLHCRIPLLAYIVVYI